LTDIIDFTHLAFGVYPKKDEEEEEEDNDSPEDEPIGYPDNPNLPDIDPDFGIPDSWERNSNSTKS